MKKGILIATDNEKFGALMETFLSRTFEVRICRNGQDALTQSEKGYIPELIICESSLLMPDGKTLILSLKESDLYKHIPVLILSDNDKAVSRTNNIIAKPFCLRDLELKVIFLLNLQLEKIGVL